MRAVDGSLSTDRRLEAVASDGPEQHIDVARRLYDERRARASLFAALDLSVAEPVWDILLTVFIAAGRAERVSVSAVCESAAAPISTALRAVYLLERKKVLRLERDKSDRRRSYAVLTDDAMQAVTAYLDRLGSRGDNPLSPVGIEDL